jgi:hypothetical protein
MERIVPLVYTSPIVDAAAVARARNIRSVNVLQPMIAGVDKPRSRYERSIIEQYEVTGLEILRRRCRPSTSSASPPSI